jgi:hypothetical protein
MESTPTGASAFARYYFGVIEQAFASGQVESLRSLSDPKCTGCQAYIDSIIRIRDADETAVGASFTITSAEAPAFEGPEARVDVIYDTDGSQIIDASGQVVYEEPASDNNGMQVSLRRQGATWTVTELVRFS